MDAGDGGRRPVRLSAQTKWEIFLAIAQGEVTQAGAARKRRVDVSVVIAVRRSVKEAALAALARKPGRQPKDRELRARGCPRRDLSPDRGCEGPGDRVGDSAGKSGLGLAGGVPARVGAEVKQMVLDTVGGAVAAGLAHRWAAALWGVSDDRVHRWRARRAGRGGSLEDRRRAGAAVHALLAQEVEAILEIAERWGPTDRSHPKLAHRGSYENLVWGCRRLRLGVFWTQTGSSWPRRRSGGESRDGRGRRGWCGNPTGSRYGT